MFHAVAQFISMNIVEFIMDVKHSRDVPDVPFCICTTKTVWTHQLIRTRMLSSSVYRVCLSFSVIHTVELVPEAAPEDVEGQGSYNNMFL